MKTPTKICCLNCRHFRNSPAYMETVYKGLNCMSSGTASVRVDDGICVLNDVYLTAYSSCEKFQSG